MPSDLFVVKKKTAADVRSDVTTINTNLEEAARILWELKQDDNWKALGKYQTFEQFCTGEIKKPTWQAYREIMEYEQKRLASANGLTISTYAQAQTLAKIKDEDQRIEVLKQATATQPNNPHTGRPYKGGPPSTHIETVAKQFALSQSNQCTDSDSESTDIDSTNESSSVSINLPKIPTQRQNLALTYTPKSDRMTTERDNSKVGVDEFDPPVTQVDDVLFAKVTGVEYFNGAQVVFVNQSCRCSKCNESLKIESQVAFTDFPQELFRRLVAPVR